MSRLRYRRLILPALSFFTAVALHAQVKVETSLIATGGASAANATMHLAGSFGQPIIGIAVTQSENISQGFWFGAKTQSPSSASEPVAGEPTLRLHCTPNPISLSATVRADFPRTGNVNVTLHDLLGREVFSLFAAEQSTGSATLELDTRELPEGHYTLVLTAGTDRTSLPIHIVR